LDKGFWRISLGRIGKNVGFVKTPNVPVLILAASCTGGDFLENVASSALTTCSILLRNVRAGLAYEGQYEDLTKCHEDAVFKVGLAKNSPGILTQHIETGASNFLHELYEMISEWLCSIIGCKPPQVQYEHSNYERILEQLASLKSLNETYAGAKPVAQGEFALYRARIQLKKKQLEDRLRALETQLSILDSRLWKHTAAGGFYSRILSFVFEPDYEMDDAIGNLTLAKKLLEAAESLGNGFRYNSAEKAARTGIEVVTKGIETLTAQENIARQTDLLPLGISVLIVMALGLLFLAALVSRFS